MRYTKIQMIKKNVSTYMQKDTYLVLRGTAKSLYSLEINMAIYIIGIHRHLTMSCINLFRGEIMPLSSSYNIPGLVPVCWLLFQCF